MHRIIAAALLFAVPAAVAEPLTVPAVLKAARQAGVAPHAVKSVTATAPAESDELTGNGCRILFPGNSDKIYRYCSDGYFAVLQNGYVLDGACYRTVEGAVQAARIHRACAFSDAVRVGRCRVLYPKETDKNHRYCASPYYGVALHSVLIDTECHDLDGALKRMEKSSVCAP